MASKERWTELFNQVIGRPPTPDEFMAGKAGGFSPKDIKTIAQAHVKESEKKAEEPTFDIAEESLESSPADREAAAEIFDVAEEAVFSTNDTSQSENLESSNSQTSQVKKENPAQKEWLIAFEKYVRRKPTSREFQEGKEANFSLASITPFVEKRKEQGSVSQAKPWSKRKKFGIIFSVSFVVGLVFAYMAGTNYYSKESVAKRYNSAVRKSFNEALKYQVWSDNYKDITEKDLKYTDTKKATVAVSAEEALNGAHLEEVGKELLIFPKWRVVVKPASADITSHASGLVISVNGKTLGTTNSNKYQKKLTHLYPGTYQFKASGKVDGQTINLSANKKLTSTEQIDLGVVYKSFEVNSNLKDGDLYAGNNKIASLTDGTYNVKELALSKTTDVYVQKTFADGTTVKSESIEASDIANDGTVTLDSDSVLDRDTANDLISAAYQKLSYYASNEKTPNELDSIFQNGNQNKFYNDVKKTIDHNLHEAKIRNADSISFSDVDVTNVSQTGKDSYTVDFTVVYSFYYSYGNGHTTSGYIKQKMSWSAHVKYVGTSDNDSYSYGGKSYKYRIVEPNGESKTLSTDNSVD